MNWLDIAIAVAISLGFHLLVTFVEIKVFGTRNQQSIDHSGKPMVQSKQEAPDTDNGTPE